MLLTPGQNTGVIEKGPSLTDYVAETSSTQILELIRNPSGDWRKYEPPGEWQKLMGVVTTNNGFNTGGVDFLDCVSFSANDAIEILGNQQIQSGLWPDTNVQWLHDNGYFNSNSTLNFSDRHTAKASGTTVNGNSLPAVAQSIHTIGLVPETMWPMPVSDIEADPNNYWSIYYADLPQNVIDKAKEFLTYFSVQYEWVFYPGSPATLQTLQNCLEIAPLQIATAVCDGWNTANPIQGCGAGSQHATVITYANSVSGDSILDHYAPFDKVLAPNYDITYAMRYIITPIIQPISPAIAQLQTRVTIATKLVAALRQLLTLIGIKPNA